MKGKNSVKREILEKLKREMMATDDVGLGDKVKELQKVTVASDSKEGLEKGLSKAQEILKKRAEMLGLEEDEEAMDEESMDEESMDNDEDDLEEKINKLKKIIDQE